MGWSRRLQAGPNYEASPQALEATLVGTSSAPGLGANQAAAEPARRFRGLFRLAPQNQLLAVAGEDRYRQSEDTEVSGHDVRDASGE